MTTTHTEHQTYRKLAGLQAVLDRAEPESLDYSCRYQILSVVAHLPKQEQVHWKRTYGSALLVALRNAHTKIPDTIEVPVLMPPALVDALASACMERGIDPDSAVCEAVTQWCREERS